MKHESAFEPRLAVAGPTLDELDRLPWLIDEPRRAQRRLSGRMLALGMVLVAVDACASYGAGRISVRDAEPVAEAQQALPDVDAQLLAQKIAEPGTVGWYRKRPNAAY